MPLHFLDLPRELRDKVYYQLFLTEACDQGIPIELREAWLHASKAVLQVNTHVRRESTSVLFDRFQIRYKRPIEFEHLRLRNTGIHIPSPYLSLAKSFDAKICVVHYHPGPLYFRGQP